MASSCGGLLLFEVLIILRLRGNRNAGIRILLHAQQLHIDLIHAGLCILGACGKPFVIATLILKLGSTGNTQKIALLLLYLTVCKAFFVCSFLGSFSAERCFAKNEAVSTNIGKTDNIRDNFRAVDKIEKTVNTKSSTKKSGEKKDEQQNVAKFLFHKTYPPLFLFFQGGLEDAEAKSGLIIVERVDIFK